MSVKVRLSRVGRKNCPHWRVVVVDSRKKRDGAFLEVLGSYDPIKHKVLQLNVDKVESWVSKGAICSNTVLKLIRIKKKGALGLGVERKVAKTAASKVKSDVVKTEKKVTATKNVGEKAES